MIFTLKYKNIYRRGGRPRPPVGYIISATGARGRAPLQRFASVGALSERPRNTAITARYCRGRRPRRPTWLHFFLRQLLVSQRGTPLGTRREGRKKTAAKSDIPPLSFSQSVFLSGLSFPSTLFLSPSCRILLFLVRLKCLSVRPNIIRVVSL